eukprot:502556-Amphidinium_carterae.1
MSKSGVFAQGTKPDAGRHGYKDVEIKELVVDSLKLRADSGVVDEWWTRVMSMAIMWMHQDAGLYEIDDVADDPNLVNLAGNGPLDVYGGQRQHSFDAALLLDK